MRQAFFIWKLNLGIMSVNAVWKLYLLFLLHLAVNAIRNEVITKSGTVIGTTVIYNDIRVKTYLGIPFAKPPVGDLRFKRTVPVKPWSTPLMANTISPACIQYFPYDYPWVDQLPGKSEDCLYLNIWAPASSSKWNPKAVMFWIHGGGFTYGSSRQPVYNGHVLSAQGDVIVVTVNYRLGLFGFLSTRSGDAPGNMGLFDILEALKWVNNNIQQFGGDKNKITVFGESAGSALVGYLYISPLSKGLFQQIIMESAAPVAIHSDIMKKNLKLGQKLAEAVGCISCNNTIEDDPEEVVQCLKGKNAMDLAYIENSFNATSVSSFRVIYGDSFLPRDPTEEVREGNYRDINILIGSVQDEGSFRLVSYKPEVFGVFGELSPQINKTYGRELILGMFQHFGERDAVANHYLGDIQESEFDAIRRQVYNSIGDFLTFCPDLYFAESYSKKGNSVYVYYYNHHSSVTPWAYWMGVTHFTEVHFVFGRPLDECSNFTLEEKALSRYVIELWTSFAKYGFPSLEWRKFTSSDPYIHHIGTSFTNYLGSHLDNCNFYRKYFGF